MSNIAITYDVSNALRNIPEDPYLSSTLRSKKTSSRCNVLIIDDDYEYIFILSKYLLSPELEVHIETDFWESLDKYNMNNFDYIVADINMGPTTGIDIYDYAQKYINETRIILLTNLTPEDVIKQMPKNRKLNCPIIYKSKGISSVCNEIRNEISHWYDIQADNRLINYLKSLKRKKTMLAT